MNDPHYTPRYIILVLRSQTMQKKQQGVSRCSLIRTITLFYISLSLSLSLQSLKTSNLVLQVDRSQIERRGKDEATGEVQSLVGKLHGYRMGDRYIRTRPPVGKEEKERPKK